MFSGGFFSWGGWVNEFNDFKIRKKKMMRHNHLLHHSAIKFCLEVELSLPS